MDDFKVWIVPAISFCCFIVFIAIFFFAQFVGINFFDDTYAEVQQTQSQDVTSVEEFQKTMNSYLK